MMDEFNLTTSNYVNKKYKEFYDKHGYIPEIFNPYNLCEIKNESITVVTSCGTICSIGG